KPLTQSRSIARRGKATDKRHFSNGAYLPLGKLFLVYQNIQQLVKRGFTIFRKNLNMCQICNKNNILYFFNPTAAFY
ncbi:MAG: hypothetical protein U9R14_00550, partial [Patescibacteria group bacterium]|nr:hypothetical protein [Patescibacteria group bacterium]